MAGHNWAPQSPDLSGYAPQSPDLSPYKAKLATNINNKPSTTSWSPQSPDISGLQPQQPPQQNHPQPSNFSLDSGWDQKPHSFGPGSHPYPTQYQQYPQQPTSYPPFYNDHPSMPSTRAQRVKEEDLEWKPQLPHNHFTPEQTHSPLDIKTPTSHGPKRMDTRGIEVKTKFPTARIKRIMQADEDVGKVAQVTPVVIGKSSFPSIISPPHRRCYCKFPSNMSLIRHQPRHSNCS